MANRKLCVRKDELAEDADWLAFSLELFSRAFQLLKDFSKFFKSRVGECCGINHDEIQLFGALNVVVVIMKSKRLGLFRDICGCAQQEKHEVISGCIIREINKVFTNLQKCCVIENVVCEVKHVLGIIEKIPTFSMSVTLKMLSYLLQEIMKKLISCRETSVDQVTRAQQTWILRLVNNFIRDWSIKNSRCRFCDHATSKVAQQWGTYCCKTLELYCDIREEWAVQQSISSVYKQEPSNIRSSSAGAYPRAFPGPEDVRAADGRRRTAGIPQEVFDIDRTVKHRGTDSGPIVTCCRVAGLSLQKTEAESYRAAASRLGDKFDGIGGSDLTMAACRRIDGELGKRARSCCNIDKDPGSSIAADRREERDDVPHGLNTVAPRNPDTDEEGTAVRKMRKIKSDMTSAPDRKRDKPLRSDTEGNGTDRSPRRMAGNRSRSRDSRLREPKEHYPDADSPKGKKGARGTRNPRGERMRGGDTDRSERDEEPSRGKKKSKRSQNVESIREQSGRSKVKKLGRMDDEEYDEDDRSDEKTTARGKKKSNRPQNLEAIDEERKGNSHRKQLSGMARETEDTDDEEKTGRRGANKVKKRMIEMEDKEDVSDTIGARERRKKKTDALDSRETKGASSHFDEEESVPKRDGKRRTRSTDDEADSDVMKRGGKIRGANPGDKSTLNSEGQSKKETNEASTKGRRGYDASKTDDDYSKINGSRSRQRTTKAPDLPKTEGRRLIEYQLSNQSFVKHGWTMMPILKPMKKVLHYQTKPAKPHLNWFERRKHQGKIYYNDGVTMFVKFHPDGSADVFYPNGEVAIEFCKPGNEKYGMYTVFSPGGKDCVGVERKSQIVGVFDTVGNGAVFDEDGATRLSYNQIGGIWRDNRTGLPLVWKWDADEKNLLVETVYQEKPATRIEKFLRPSLKSTGSGKAPSSPASSRNKEKQVVEQKPVVAVHDSEEEVTSGTFSDADKHTKDNPQLKMICMKLTNNISLRISNRREISLQFFAATKNLRIELGTVLNFKKEVASHYVDTNLSNAMLKCKFDDLLKSPVKPEGVSQNLVERLREVRKSARQRKFMMKKYKPYLPLQKALPHRCCL